MSRARRKSPKGRPYLASVATLVPADEGMRLYRIRHYGATDADWRDQRWESPHGRLAIRGERWERLSVTARRKLSQRETLWIDRDEFDAAVKYLGVRMAFLRAYGAPGLPIETIGDDQFSCPICGALAKCDPCEANWQHEISDALDEANRAIRSVGGGHKDAINAILMNPAASCDFIPEERLPAMILPLREALRALAVLFNSSKRRAA